VAHLGLYEEYYERKTPAALVFDDFSKKITKIADIHVCIKVVAVSLQK
jgi:hypothetical protein